jgi:RNA polymerase sigma-32 factor
LAKRQSKKKREGSPASSESSALPASEPCTDTHEPKEGHEPEIEVLPGDATEEPSDSFEEESDLGEFPDAEQDDRYEIVPASRSGALVPYNPLDAYLAEIRRFRPLTKEEEHETAVQYNRTKSAEAAYKLVSSNLWLVVKIARDYERVARNVLDLIQEGNIGLMEAVKNFDPYRGVRFPSYAVWWIKAYIIRYIIANWRLVKIGTTQAQRKLFFNLKKESERLEREGIFPTTKLLAERLNVREGDVVEMTQRLGGPDVSVDAPLQDQSEGTLLSLLASDRESVEDSMAKRELHNLLKSSVSEFEEGLSDKEKAIFRGRIIEEDKLTLQELSDQLSLSKERIRQIENKLRGKLRVFVSGKLGSELEGWIDTKSE